MKHADDHHRIACWTTTEALRLEIEGGPPLRGFLAVGYQIMGQKAC
jgi:hypothetical protein